MKGKNKKAPLTLGERQIAVPGSYLIVSAPFTRGANTIEVLARVRDLEIEDFEGSWFRRLAVSVCVWMRLRDVTKLR